MDKQSVVVVVPAMAVDGIERTGNLECGQDAWRSILSSTVDTVSHWPSGLGCLGKKAPGRALCEDAAGN
jgi:hypothetical protein